MKRTIGRRTFLAGAGALGALTVAGCTIDDSSTEEFMLGNFNQLRMLNWAEYIDPELLPVIENAIGATIDYFPLQDGDPEYVDNVDAWQNIIAPVLGSGGVLPYDIIVPTNWLAARMIALGWVEPLPIEEIPNHINVEPAYLVNSWDRGSRYQMPWQAGITGIAYNPELTGREIRSVADLFDPEFAGRVGMNVEMRETVGLRMLLEGNDPSRPTFDAASQALEAITLADQAGQFGAWTANEFTDLLISGDLALTMAWSGDTVQLQAERPDLEFVIPDEGAIQWFDTMVIPRGAPNIGAAGRFMNAVYDPSLAAQITNWVQYISPVVGVQSELDRIGGEAAELANNPILFPDADTKRRLFTWGGLSDDEEAALETNFDQLL